MSKIGRFFQTRDRKPKARADTRSNITYFLEWTRCFPDKAIVFVKMGVTIRSRMNTAALWIFETKTRGELDANKTPTHASAATSQTRPTWHRKYLNVEERQESTYRRMLAISRTTIIFHYIAFCIKKLSSFFSNYKWRKK